jgi:hypothetical protein
MKDNKQLTEQELDQVAGGVVNPDSMCPNPRGRRGIIVPDYKVRGAPKGNTVGFDIGPIGRVSGRYGVINPDSM